jgi:hypothetical protein
VVSSPPLPSPAPSTHLPVSGRRRLQLLAVPLPAQKLLLLLLKALLGFHEVRVLPRVQAHQCYLPASTCILYWNSYTRIPVIPYFLHALAMICITEGSTFRANRV